MAQDRDLKLISQQFEKYQLPKEKKYLKKYFRTPLGWAFLKYFFVFGEYQNFTDHTGIKCQTRSLRELHQRLILLEDAHKNARKDMDMEKLTLIESGKFKHRKEL